MRSRSVLLFAFMVGCSSSTPHTDSGVDALCTIGSVFPCNGCPQGTGTVTCLPPGVYTQCECPMLDGGVTDAGQSRSDAAVDVNVPGTDVGWDVGETCTPGATCECGGGTTATLVCTAAAVGYCACEADNVDGGNTDVLVTDVPTADVPG